MKIMTRHNSIRSFIVTMLVASTMVLTAIPVFAGNGGSYTATGTYQPEGVTLSESTTFTLYQVGTFGHDASGKSNFVLDNALSNCSARIDIDQSDDAWMESASTLADYIETQKPNIWSETTTLPAGQNQFQFSGLKPGLYLLTGTRQTVGNTWYEPLPMYVMILKGDSEFTVKPDSGSDEKDKCKYTVRKAWSDSGHEKMRPKSIKVDIYYGEEKVETVTLSEKNNWTYSWETDKTDKKWRCVERLSKKDKKNYKVTVVRTENGETTFITLTNKYDGPPTTPPSKTKTGDTFHLLVPICLMIAAVLAILALIVSRRRTGRRG